MAIRLSGMNSGLDTDSIVTALVSSYTSRKEKYEKAQTKLSWKQDAWKSLNTKVYSLYSNISSLRFSSAYSLKKTTVSDSTKASVTASSSAPNGTQSLKVKDTAKAGYLTGEQINAASSSTTLAQLGYTGGDANINVTVGDSTKTITISSTSTMSDVEKKLKEAGINASYDTTYKRFYISSKDTGVDNDFTLTGADSNGASALYKLGIAIGASSDGSRANPYAKYESLYGDDTDSTTSTQAKVEAAVKAYNDASSTVAKSNAQSTNLLNAITYSTAYSDVQDFYAPLGTDVDTTKLETLAKLGSGRSSAVISKNADGSYTTYSKTSVTDTAGNTVYKSADGKYISAEETYVDSSTGATYKKESDVNYVNVDGSGDKYSGDTDRLTKKTTYHTVEETTKYTAKITEGDETKEVEFTKNEDGTYTETNSQVVYTKRDDGKYYAAGKADDSTNGISITESAEYTSATDTLSDTESATDAYTDITANIDADKLSAYTSNLSTVTSFESTTDSVLSESDDYTIAKLTEAIHSAYASGGKEGVAALVAGNTSTDSTTDTSSTSVGYATIVANLASEIETAQQTMEDNSLVKDLASITDQTSDEYKSALESFVKTVNAAHELYSTAQYNTKASKIDGQDATIELNGVEYTGASNTFNINGLTITALAKTADDDEISITTSTDTQGIYDKIKDFLTEYNNIINEMTKLYNAESAGSYEPLTDDEKEEMSDSEIEKWETKIKDSLLKNDTTLSGVMSAMQNAMSSAIEINGKKYSFSSFGIHTLGYLNAADNEQNAYHIDGDEDDSNTSGNSDKLLTAIANDPDSVMSFMQQISAKLYTAIGNKMSATSLSSAFTIYNDKQMSTEYSQYTTLIKEWETKISDKEEYYYNKFSNMETSLAKLNSTQSSLSGYFS